MLCFFVDITFVVPCYAGDQLLCLDSFVHLQSGQFSVLCLYALSHHLVYVKLFIVFVLYTPLLTSLVKTLYFDHGCR